MNKKIVALSLILVMAAALAVGCTDKTETGSISDTFLNFSSTGEYTSATKKLTLSSGQTFTSYDADSGVFVIREDVSLGEALYTRYGLASEDEV